jgi:hypothetical protein
MDILATPFPLGASMPFLPAKIATLLALRHGLATGAGSLCGYGAFTTLLGVLIGGLCVFRHRQGERGDAL